MPKVKYIASPKEIPAEQKYVLVVYGEEHAQTKHLLGLTITVGVALGAGVVAVQTKTSAIPACLAIPLAT